MSTFTAEEKKQIIEFIIKENGYYNLHGNILFKLMSKEIDRPWQSLREHFKKKLFPNLLEYEKKFNIELKKLALIKLAYIQSSFCKNWEAEEEELGKLLDYARIDWDARNRERQMNRKRMLIYDSDSEDDESNATTDVVENTPENPTIIIDDETPDADAEVAGPSTQEAEENMEQSDIDSTEADKASSDGDMTTSEELQVFGYKDSADGIQVIDSDSTADEI